MLGLVLRRQRDGSSPLHFITVCREGGHAIRGLPIQQVAGMEGLPAVHEAERERSKILGIVGPITTEELDELLESELRLAWNETVDQSAA